MTASSIFSPSFASASLFNFARMNAEISSGVWFFSPIRTCTPPCSPSRISYGIQFLSRWTSWSENFLPMSRFTENTVFLGLVMDCRLASTPVRRSPVLETATTDGVVRFPSAFSRMRGSPPSMTAIAEFVVPRSMPSILLMLFVFINAILIYEYILMILIIRGIRMKFGFFGPHRTFAYLYPRRTDDLIEQLVARLHLFRHRSGGFVRFLLGYRLLERGVEFVSRPDRDPRETSLSQSVLHLCPDHIYAFLRPDGLRRRDSGSGFAGHRSFFAL